MLTEIKCTRMSLNLKEDMHDSEHAQNYNFKEMVTMSCISDFIGITVTSQCTDVNNWSHKPPICTSKILFLAISTPNQ